ncbi:hypothetical protein DFH07DRAFT_823167 [Mycena maculata]|uniref:F-box domain-containing protein n=1 Tax=Mycena maculata TaxID=230809 RepID=A0AAD7J267_9AGAR|nr:hypothetical protein DFH07DRAFT_823167 [Mycena maculata]
MSNEFPQSEELAALISCVTLSASLPAPVHRLPPEILTRIFPLCAPSYDDPVRYDWQYRSARRQIERLAQKHLLDLAGVCSQWLVLIMGTPSLWGSVEVDCTSAWSPRHMDILTKVLQRSAGTPLKIYVRHIENTRQRAALLMLAENSARWEEASLSLNWLGAEILSHVRGNLPQLKLLRIGSPELDAFETAPLLTDVCVRSVVFPVIRWSQVKILEIWGLRTHYGALSVLPRCSMLIELFIILNGNSTLTAPPDDEAITCDTVETLTLEGCDRDPYGYAAEILGHVLSSLTLPSLHKLCLLPTVAPWQQQPFLGFSQRSSLSNTLTFLEIRGIDIDTADLVELLAELPSLRTLWLTDVAPSAERSEHIIINDYLLHSLTRTADSFVVPSLKQISLHSYAPFTTKAFLDFATSRWDNPTRASPVNIYLWIAATAPDVDSATVVELQAMATRLKCIFLYRKLRW